MARNFFVDVSHSGGSSEFASRFYVDEYITMNGSVVTGYINRIKYKNVRGWIGLGPNICFGETINISKAASAPCSVNFLGLIGSLIPAKYTTATAIFNAFSNIDYCNPSSGSYSLTSSRSGIGCKFNGVTLDEDEEFVKVSSFVSTVDSSRPTNVSVDVVFNWTFDVYKGASKYTSTSLRGDYKVYANYTG